MVVVEASGGGGGNDSGVRKRVAGGGEWWWWWRRVGILEVGSGVRERVISPVIDYIWVMTFVVFVVFGYYHSSAYV